MGVGQVQGSMVRVGSVGTHAERPEGLQGPYPRELKQVQRGGGTIIICASLFHFLCAFKFMSVFYLMYYCLL